MPDFKKKYIGEDFNGLPIKNLPAPVDGSDPATKTSAQAQADAAKAAAEATAATLAATAKSEAITAAATDATTKATTAETNAKTYTDGKITALIASAPAALDTLNELAAALGNDANFASSVTTTLAGKTNKFAANIQGTPEPVAGNYEYPVTHNLNKADIVVQAFQGNDSVDVLVRKTDDNSLKIITGSPLGATVLRIVVVG